MDTLPDLTAEQRFYGAFQEKAKRSLLWYARLMVPGYKATRHGELIIQYLEKLERGEIRNLIIEMPPQHGKSLHAAQLFPSWYMGKHPREHALVASYGADLAERNSKMMRAFVGDPKYPFEARIDPNSRAVDSWKLTTGGTVTAKGIAGGLTGYTGNLVVIDDPVVDRKEAESENQRKSIWDWYVNTMLTRQNNFARQLVMMTRWHLQDMVGMLLEVEPENWTVLRIPALAEEDDPLGREIGEPLWPEMFSKELLEKRRKSMGLDFEALYQQNPVPPGGLMFKEEWLKNTYDELPKLPLRIFSIDAGWEKALRNDRSVIAHWGTDGDKYYLIDVWPMRVEYPQLRDTVKRLYHEHRPNGIYVEKAANGRGLVQELLQSKDLPPGVVVGVEPLGKKEARAAAVTPCFANGKVFLPKIASWKDDWVIEHLNFPGYKHDDMVDSTQIALNQLVLRTTISKRPDYSRYQGFMAR